MQKNTHFSVKSIGNRRSLLVDLSVHISAGRRTVWDVPCMLSSVISYGVVFGPAPYSPTATHSTHVADKHACERCHIVTLAARWNFTRGGNKFGLRARKPPGVPLLLEIVLVAIRVGFLF